MDAAGERLTIRPFSHGDRHALEHDMPSQHHRYRIAAHERGEATFLLAWEQDRVVGYLLVKWDGSDAELVRRLLGAWPELNAITVVAHRRSRGIGRALIRHAERLVAARGNDRVTLGVGVANRRARALYERLGYRVWEHGDFQVSWESPNSPTGREYGTYVQMVKHLGTRVA